MLRTLANRLSGRRETVNEKIKYRDAARLLQELNMESIINGVNMEWKNGERHGIFGISPEEVLQHLKPFYPYSRRLYCGGTHQVFIDGKVVGREKHYIDLEYGQIRKDLGKERFSLSPNKRAKINYFVES